MTQPIFRLVENSFYLEDSFESSEDYDKTQRKPTHFSRCMNLANNFV